MPDGQNFGQFDDSPLMLNGNVLANGGTFQGATVPSNPNTAVQNGSLWDIVSFDLTPYLTTGSNDLLFSLGSNTDALSLVFAAINLPAGSTDGVIPVDPEGPVVSAVPLPPTLLLMLSGLGAMFVRRNRRARGACLASATAIS